MNVAFVHVPKTGGGSVKHWWTYDVSPRHNLITHAHEPLSLIKYRHDVNIDTSFALVRNTWSRLISVYTFARYKALKKLQKRPGNQDAIEVLRQYDRGIVSFLSWMYDMDHINVWCQVRYTENVKHVIADNDINSWQRFLDLLCIKTLPARTHRVQTYRAQDFWSKQYISWVAGRYQLEISRFGFKPPETK